MKNTQCLSKIRQVCFKNVDKWGNVWYYIQLSIKGVTGRGVKGLQVTASHSSMSGAWEEYRWRKDVGFADEVCKPIRWLLADCGALEKEFV